jgi:hypothetical protein
MRKSGNEDEIIKERGQGPSEKCFTAWGDTNNGDFTIQCQAHE